ncbi:hypothetical protein KY495_19680 [Massilia sp. PAMC28688]|uniref:hypothetical protein n=1 Tax=Massilia sp. PAMC28688 TaxID=2861283 RepID=UPI001C63069B|nr:hypothetical protein [Massilia sp. PAMC28688]QYF92908.1 hypothetical protein KY495_19680 [Massilia sp. PAMC28688]
MQKTFGASPWLVYACSDNTSVVVVSAPDSPGNPFYFMLYLKEGVRYVMGRGTGSPAVSAAAHKEIIRLNEEEIAALINAANAVPRAAR